MDVKNVDNGGRNIILNQAEFIDRGSLSRDSAFNVTAWGVRKSSNGFFGWLAKTCTKKVAHSEQAGSTKPALV